MDGGNAHVARAGLPPTASSRTSAAVSALDIFTSVLGVIGVWLMIRQNVWGWPVGLIQVALSGWIFYQSKLYSDTILQAVYFVLQAYGWWYWLRGGSRKTPPPITSLSSRAILVWCAGAAVLTFVHGWGMARYTDAALPWWDAFILIAGLMAQWWQARKYLECWAGWVVVNLVSVGVYWVKNLGVFSALAVVFLALAIAGHVAWRRAFRVRRVAVFGPESTGKTMLAEFLGKHFREPVVPEYAREFWDRKGAITLSDIPAIAHHQAETEDARAESAHRVLICDTDALTTVLWSDLLYHDCPVAVRASAESRARRYAVYLLLNTDVPFTPDPQRVFPDEAARERCMVLWREALVSRGLPFVEIRGTWPQREMAAIAAVEQLLAAGPVGGKITANAAARDIS